MNDAKSWSAVLRKQYDFTSADVRVLLDKAATHEQVTDGLKALLAGARSGDVLVFTNSSHGTYVADGGSDEADRYDEAMCPYDCKTALLTDDELRTLFADIPRGVRLTVISDSCHSGSVTRAAVGAATPDDRRVRFLNPRKLRQAGDQGRPAQGARHASGGLPRVGDEGAPAVGVPVEPVQLRRPLRTPLPRAR